MKAGTLYIVSTPIGNLEDITLRALRVLKEASLIAAEDTRHTKKLLTHFGVSTPVTSYHEHNESEKSVSLIERLKKGEDIALVSDAGTPGISDPGFRLTRLAVESGLQVVAVPGPSAVLSVLSVSGFAIDRFTFLGFAPQGGAEKKRFILEMKVPEHTFVLYDSPRRLRDTLEAIVEVIGDVEVVVGREMTKMHEEVLRGKASVVGKELAGRAEIKGEVTLVVRTGVFESEASFEDELKRLLEQGFHIKEAARAVAQEFGLPKSDVYREALRIKECIKE